MPLYTSTGAFNVAVNDTTGTGRYSASGALRINLVTGSSYVGLYAADGALNVVDVSGVAVSAYGGLYHPSGAIRGRTAPTTLSGLQAPDGSYYFLGLFSPLNLFANGEQGAWYDPSDLSTMFQDAAGTTPVTAVEQPVGLVLDKSKGLTLGAELAGTLPTPTIFDAGGTVGTWDAGTRTFGNTGANVAGRPRFNFDLGMVAGKTYLVSGQLSGAISKLNLVRLGASLGTNIYTPATGALLGRVAATDQFLHFQFSLNNGETVTIDNISIRELPGNHATQSTAASRPIYAVVPQTGRRNLLTNTEGISTYTNVSGGSSTATTAVNPPSVAAQVFAFTENTANSVHYLRVGYPFVGTVNSVGSIYLKAAGRSQVAFGVRGSITANAQFDLSTGQFIGAANGVVATPVGDGWYRLSRVNFGGTAIGANILAADAAGATTYLGDGRVAFYMTAAQFEENPGQTATAYQRVGSAFDVTEAGVPSLSYLSFDGVDDSLATGTIDPGGVDKAQVFAGVRKLSDAARGVIAEFSDTIASNNGAFNLTAPNAASDTFAFESKGTNLTDAVGTGFTAPLTRVLTGLGDIAGDRATLRVNGVQADQDTGDQGTGNYGSYVLRIGSRGGSSLRFNGHLFSLIARFSATNLTDAQIASTETYVNNLTKAY